MDKIPIVIYGAAKVITGLEVSKYSAINIEKYRKGEMAVELSRKIVDSLIGVYPSKYLSGIEIKWEIVAMGKEDFFQLLKDARYQWISNALDNCVIIDTLNNL